MDRPRTMADRAYPIEIQHFGPLLSLPEAELLSLATRIRKDTLGDSTTKGKLLERIVGSYNINHIIELDDFKLVIRVPASGWGVHMAGPAADAMKMQVATLRFLDKKTTIPAPKVYDFDVTPVNDLCAPYICTSFLEGESLAGAWFDDTRKITLEDRRMKTLESLAGYMAQLAPFKFDMAGSLVENELGEFSIGHCFHIDTVNNNSDVRVLSLGPYELWSEYLFEHYDYRSRPADDRWDKGENRVMEAILDVMPWACTSSGFVLAKPGIEAANVLVDEAGNITGLLNWDCTITVAPCVGFGSYPSFIARDWDPNSYRWPKNSGDGKEENSPEELEKYRRYYNQALGMALHESEDWKWTEKSHIREAVHSAILHAEFRLEICKKLVGEALEVEDGGNKIYRIGEGLYSREEWEELKMGLEQLVLDD